MYMCIYIYISIEFTCKYAFFCTMLYWSCKTKQIPRWLIPNLFQCIGASAVLLH